MGEGQRRRETTRRSCAPSGLNLRTLRSRPEPEPRVRRFTDWATQAPQNHTFWGSFEVRPESLSLGRLTLLEEHASPFLSTLPPVCWRHKSKRTVCLPRECVSAETYSSTQLLLREENHSACQARSQLSPPCSSTAEHSPMVIPVTVTQWSWKRGGAQASDSHLRADLYLAEDEKYGYDWPQGVESHRVKF